MEKWRKMKSQQNPCEIKGNLLLFNIRMLHCKFTWGKVAKNIFERKWCKKILLRDEWLSKFVSFKCLCQYILSSWILNALLQIQSSNLAIKKESQNYSANIQRPRIKLWCVYERITCIVMIYFIKSRLEHTKSEKL